MAARTSPRIVAALVAPIALARCAPPPPTLAFEGTHRDPVGSVSAGGFVSYTGDYTSVGWGASPAPPSGGASSFNPSGLGDVRVDYQAVRDVAVGGDVAGGAMVDSSGRTLSTVLGRVHGQVNGGDNFAVVAGVGGGALLSSDGAAATGLFTGDFGMRLGFSDPGRLMDFVLAETVAVTVASSGSSSAAVLHTDTDLGFVVHPVPRLGLGAFASMLWSFADQDGMSRPAFVPSLSVRWTAGGDPPPQRQRSH